MVCVAGVKFTGGPLSAPSGWMVRAALERFTMAGDVSNDPRLADVIIKSILLVEDEADEAEFIKVLLERAGYNVLIAKDGGQAQSILVMRKPDFVILDLILPNESGFEICERFKQTEKEIPVLILSAIELDDAKDLARRVGADGYLTKPFEPQVLLDQIVETARAMWVKSRAMLNREASAEDRVRFNCRCGKRFKVSAAHRGKTLTCPSCGESVVVPKEG